MNHFRLPKSYERQGSTITVIESSADEFDTNCTFGDWSPYELQIRIRKGLHKEHLAHTFFHEALHDWLEALGKTELSNDEKFVDAFAGLIAQYHKTARY